MIQHGNEANYFPNHGKTNCVKNVIEKAVSICVIIQFKLQLHNNKVSSTTVWRFVTNKGWKALKRKRRCTLHAGMASEEFANFIPKDRPANSGEANPLVTIWIIVDETTYKDPAPKTLD